MLTLWVIFVSFFAIFFIGIPCTCLLQVKNRVINNDILILSPFIGIAVIILFCQNFIYLLLPIKTTYYWLYFLALVGWIYLLCSKKPPGLLNKSTLKLLSIALLVYFIQAAGLLTHGANNYVGWAWYDQTNYTFMAQYLTDLPFRLSSSPTIQYIPYALKAITLLSDRIGQSIFHGFIAKSTFTDAKITFEPVILLLPPLIVFIIYKLARELGLNEFSSLVTSAISALLPGVAYLHLESFLSQALCVPFLLIWPYVLYRALMHLHWKNILLAALVLAAGHSIYTEFYPLFLIISFIVTIRQCFSQNNPFFKTILCSISILILALLLNPGYIVYSMKVLMRVNLDSAILNSIFPWANKIEGIDRLWLGHWVVSTPKWFQWIIGLTSCVFILVAYCGLARTLWKKNDALIWGVVTISALPLMLLPHILTQKYQFYKILLSICPLFTLGISLWINEYKTYKLKTVKIALVTLITVVSTSTFSLNTFASAEGCSLTPVWASPAAKAISKKLLSFQDKNIVILSQHYKLYATWLNNKGFTTWLAYYSRNNRTWLLNPQPADLSISYANFPKNIPNNFYLILPTELMNINSHLTANIIWQQGEFTILDIKSPGVIITSIDTSGGPVQWNSNGIQLDKAKTSLELFSSQAGLNSLFLNINSLPYNKEMKLQITTDQNLTKNINVLYPGNYEIILPMKAGKNTVDILSRS